MSLKRTLCVTVTIFIVVIVVLMSLVIWLATRTTQAETEICFSQSTGLTGYIRPKALQTDDGINVKWFPGATQPSDVNSAVKDAFDMVDISLTQTHNQNDVFTLDYVSNMLQSNNIGAKINVVSNNQAEEAISKLKDLVIDEPTLLSVPLSNRDFDWQRFTQTMSDSTFITPIAINVRILPQSFQLEHGIMEYVGYLIKQSNFSMTVEMDADWIKSSWTEIKWLLDTNPNVQLILSTATNYSVTKYDLLMARNDMDGDKVFYNIDPALYHEFMDLASSAGSPLLYFGINPRDASKVRWSHNTDTWNLLNNATQGDTMMIEGDIMLLGQDTVKQTEVPIMAHTVGDNNNLTFLEWLDEIIKVDKGMKLDFKTIDAVRPTLEIIKRKKSQIKGPVWANADILQGPNAKIPRLTAYEFLDAVSTFPNVVLSLGWTTVAKGDQYNLSYTLDMVEEMYETVKDLLVPITFPIRAEQLVDSWSALDWLLSRSSAYTLTVWTSKHDNVTKADMDPIRRKTEAARIYFDLPVDLRPTLF